MVAVAPLLAQTKSTPAEPIIERAAVYMGEKLLDKLVTAGANRVIEAGWNASFGSLAERVGELHRRLAGYHGLLTQLAKDHPVDGRLGVPPALLGPQASEMMIAFNLAGANSTLVAEPYRREFLANVDSDPAAIVSGHRFPYFLRDVQKQKSRRAIELWRVGLKRRGRDSPKACLLLFPFVAPC